MPESSEVQLVKDFSEKYQLLTQEIKKTIVGQEQVITQLLLSLFCNSHCLIVGAPGLAKTLLINTISKTLSISFSRIQFTPDLMPSDIIGTEILTKEKDFNFIKGPLFANIVLADEINRTPPKTQAALLEAMQEKKVTVAGKRYSLPNPFFVLATQNPIEQEGTYPLPEAQLDRFMFNIWIDYPEYEQELNIVRKTHEEKIIETNNILTVEEILKFQQLLAKVPVTDNLISYAVNLVRSTRPEDKKAHQLTKDFVSWGAGPRASQFLIKAAKAFALINGKFSPDIEDVKQVALPILRHRVILNYKAETEGHTVSSIINALLKSNL